MAARSRNLAANRRSLVIRLRAGSVPPRHKKNARHEIWTVQEKCRILDVFQPSRTCQVSCVAGSGPGPQSMDPVVLGAMALIIPFRNGLIGHLVTACSD